MDNKTRALLQGVGSLLNLRGQSSFSVCNNVSSDASALKDDWSKIIMLETEVHNGR